MPSSEPDADLCLPDAAASAAGPGPGTDLLTGLAQRLPFRQALQARLDQAPGRELAVLWADLDRFQAVNEAHGMCAGDAVLRTLAERLRGLAAPADLLARAGDDVFVWAVSPAGRPGGVAALALQLAERLRQPCEVCDADGRLVSVFASASVGLAVAPWDAADADALVRAAELAARAAKAQGGNQTCFYEPAMGQLQGRQRALEASLHEALARGELHLVFQPQVRLRDGQVQGLEALLRWNHPQHGSVSPAEFIPLAERSGLIVPIGRWVLQEACRQAARWPQPLRVAVNVSARQLRVRELPQDVFDALRDSGLAPQRLELEITEAGLIDEPEQALALMQGLRGRGIRLALDDFGTGYSSLAYLRRFPFDVLKIDRSFVVDAERRDDAQAVLRAISELGRALGMSTVAEGVETPAQLATVQASACSEVQGYLFSPPRTPEQVQALMATGWPTLPGTPGTAAGPHPALAA